MTKIPLLSNISTASVVAVWFILHALAALHGPDGAAREKHNPLQFLVVEEVVEGPEASFFAKRVRVQVRVVAERQRGLKSKTQQRPVLQPEPFRPTGPTRILLVVQYSYL